MKYLLLLVLMNLNSAYASGSEEECKNVNGTLALWNGWPPSLRIESEDNANVYGVPEPTEEDVAAVIPEPLLDKVRSEGKVKGIFCIELTGDIQKVPYDNRPIIMATISSFTKETLK